MPCLAFTTKHKVTMTALERHFGVSRPSHEKHRVIGTGGEKAGLKLYCKGLTYCHPGLHIRSNDLRIRQIRVEKSTQWNTWPVLATNGNVVARRQHVNGLPVLPNPVKVQKVCALVEEWSH